MVLTPHNAAITPCLLHVKQRLTTVRCYLIISSKCALHWGVRALTRSKKRKASDKLWVMKTVSPPSCNPWESKEELASVWTLVLVVGFWKEILFTLYTRPELYKPCSANKMHTGCIQTSLNATRHAGVYFCLIFLDDLCMIWRRYFKSPQCTFLDTNPICIPWGCSAMQFFA